MHQLRIMSWVNSWVCMAPCFGALCSAISAKIFSASGEESASSDLGMYSAPSSAFRILGASPKFKIVDFYGYVRVIKLYSPIALFVALNTSLKDQKFGQRVFRFIPNTLVLSTWGQKPTTGQLSDFINGRTEGNILN